MDTAQMPLSYRVYLAISSRKRDHLDAEDVSLQGEVQSLEAQLDEAREENARLQRGRCGYCNWGDDASHTFEELQAHIKICEFHPLAKYLTRIAALEAEIAIEREVCVERGIVARFAFDRIAALEAKLTKPRLRLLPPREPNISPLLEEEERP